MYNFVDVNEAAENIDMSIQTVVNGFNLDKTIKGFTTLKVNGRELIGRNISTQDFKSVSGGGKRETSRNFKNSSFSTNKFLGSSLPSRTLEVEFMLRAETNKEFRQVCEMLNYYLHSEQMSVQFTDDLAYEYVGTLSSVSDIDALSNTIVGSFSIECAEPFKYSVMERVFSFEDSGLFSYDTLYPVIISRVIIKIKDGGKFLTLANSSTGDRIMFDHNFKAKDFVEINFADNTIMKNGITNIMKDLALASDLESFNAIINDELVCNLASEVEVYFNERRL